MRQLVYLIEMTKRISHTSCKALSLAALFLGLLVLPDDGIAQRWVEVTPGSEEIPPARSNAAAIYDPVDHRVVLFGGRSDSGVLNDVWSLDLNAVEWTRHDPSGGASPPPRLTPAAVYDEAGHRMVIWSGQGAEFYNDVWAFDLSTHTWTELTPTTFGPNIRYGVASVFDPRSRSFVTFAGFTDAGRFNDTWVFDLQNQEWEEVTPADSPGRRCLHTASYDPLEHRMIVYGGQRSGPLDDLWAFDLDSRTWSELKSSTETAGGRYFSPSVLDTRNSRLLVFGGNRGSAGLSDEVLSYSLQEDVWERVMTSAPKPEARQGAVAVYIESEDRVIVIGGRNSQFLNDVWSLELESTSTGTERVDQPRAPSLQLSQNFPNPLTESTTIAFELSQPTPVVLTVYDLIGREVRRLVDGMKSPGSHAVEWDGRDTKGRRVAAGIYLYEVRSNNRSSTRLLTVVGR